MALTAKRRRWWPSSSSPAGLRCASPAQQEQQPGRRAARRACGPCTAVPRPSAPRVPRGEGTLRCGPCPMRAAQQPRAAQPGQASCVGLPCPPPRSAYCTPADYQICGAGDSKPAEAAPPTCDPTQGGVFRAVPRRIACRPGAPIAPAGRTCIQAGVSTPFHRYCAAQAQNSWGVTILAAAAAAGRRASAVPMPGVQAALLTSRLEMQVFLTTNHLVLAMELANSGNLLQHVRCWGACRGLGVRVGRWGVAGWGLRESGEA